VGCETFYASYDSSHNVDHAFKVLENALEIMQHEDISMGVFCWAIFPLVMLGHDILDHKMVERGIAPNHASVHKFYTDVVTELAVKMDWPDRVIDELVFSIEQIHLNCSWSKRIASIKCNQYHLQKILQDADWLESTGRICLERCWSYQLELRSHAIINNTEPDYQHLFTIICRHIEEKIIHIPASMNYKHTQERASAANKIVIEFYNIYLDNE
jgi:HD superfamily phosphodiesterase